MFKTDSPGTPFCEAAAIRRTTPGPKSTRYGVPLTTIAVAGPERSGSGLGVPVPSRTMRVFDVESRGARALTCSDKWQHAATVQRPIRYCLVNMKRLAQLKAGFVARFYRCFSVSRAIRVRLRRGAVRRPDVVSAIAFPEPSTRKPHRTRQRHMAGGIDQVIDRLQAIVQQSI